METALRGALLATLVLVAVGGCERRGPAADAPPVSLALSPEQVDAAGDPRIPGLQAAVARQPENPERWIELGDAWMQKSRSAPGASYQRLAERSYERALALEPENALALAGLAWVAGFEHDFDGSADYARRALALEPDLRAAHGLLGDAALELGRDDLAREHYQAMLDLGPDLASYSRAAELLYRTGDARRGMALMRRAVEAAGDDPEHVAWARARLARMLWGVGNLVVAERTLAPAIEVAPRHQEVLIVQGLLATARGDFEAARGAYQQAQAISPRHDVLVALLDLARAAGRPDEARDLIATIEAIGGDAPGTPDADLQMARFWADEERHLERAVERAESARARRETAAAADTLAWCYFKSGRIEEAAPLAAEARARRPNDAAVLFHGGMIEAARVHRSAARQLLYRALNLNPNFRHADALRASETLAALARGGAERVEAPPPKPPEGVESDPDRSPRPGVSAAR